MAETRDSAGPNLARLAGQLEEAKFARFFRYIANLPADGDYLLMDAIPYSFGESSFLARIIGKVSALSSWANAWIFQSAYLPPSLWTEEGLVARLKDAIDQANRDISAHPRGRDLFYPDIPNPENIVQMPIVTDSMHYLVTNACVELSNRAIGELACHYHARFGGPATDEGISTMFGVATPLSVAANAGAELQAFMHSLVSMPSSYYFLAREGRIRLASALDHGSYFVREAGIAARATAVSLHRTEVGVITDFEALLNLAKVSEADIQAFLTVHPELLFALDERYCEIRPHVTLTGPGGASLVPDFMIRIEDSDRWDMIELKKPTAPIMASRHDTSRASKPAAQAIRQLLDYKDAVGTREARNALRKAYGGDAYEPSLAVVIGRGTPSEPHHWIAPKPGFPDVRLVSYDYLIERARNSANLIAAQAELFPQDQLRPPSRS